MKQKTVLLSSLCSVLVLSGCCRFCESEPSPIVAVPAPGVVTPDGRIDEKERAGAPVYQMTDVPACIRPDNPEKYAANMGGGLLELGTVRVMYDQNYLYVAADLKDSDIVNYGGEEQSAFFLTGDTFEIFPKPQIYPEFRVCYVIPHGKRTTRVYETRDCPVNSKKSVRQDGYRGAAVVHGAFNNYKDKDEGWTPEAAIPFRMPEKTVVKFVPGEPWTILSARMNCSYGSMEGGARLPGCPKLPKADFRLMEYYPPLVLKEMPQMTKKSRCQDNFVFAVGSSEKITQYAENKNGQAATDESCFT